MTKDTKLPHIIIAPDSFKGSLSAELVASAIAKGVRRAWPEVHITEIPIADGGEGTLDCMIAAGDGRKITVPVHDPLGRTIEAAFGVLASDPESPIAIIEMACASGLGLVDPTSRDPLRTSTYGTGQLIRAALDHGYRRFILALGGSATNDGGIGMLQALGIQLRDATGEIIADGAGGAQLAQIATITTDDLDPRIAQSHFLIASDVKNPLLGPQGASTIFGPQKGATPDIVTQLEAGMRNWADLTYEATGIRMHDLPGAGAAGGIGGAFSAYFPSEIHRGIDVVIAHSDLRKHLPAAQLVITGEGQIDHQTASGKTPMGIAEEAQKFGVPTIALAGSVGEGIDVLYKHGLQAVFSLVNGPMTLEQAMDNTAPLLEQAAEQMIRLFRLGQRAN